MLSMQPMLTLIKESLGIVFGEGKVADTTVLKENLTDKENMPYFWLLLGHQETLWPLTAALGVDRAAKLPFGSAYFFEFMSFEEKDYVSVMFRDDKGKMNEVEVACSLDTKVGTYEHACTREGFESFIDDRLKIANEVACDVDYVHKDGTFIDEELFAENMLIDIFGSKQEKSVRAAPADDKTDETTDDKSGDANAADVTDSAAKTLEDSAAGVITALSTSAVLALGLAVL